MNKPDKIVVIKVLSDSDIGSEVTRLLTGDDSKYVGMVKGRIVLGDKAHAIRYRMKTDNVEKQIAEVKRLYGVTWVAEEWTG